MKPLSYIKAVSILLMIIGLVPKAAMAATFTPAATVAIFNGAQLGGKGSSRSARGDQECGQQRGGGPAGIGQTFNRPQNRRKWRGRRWGAQIGGIIVGTAVGVAIAGQAPPRPADGLCWTWNNPARTSGYWSDC